MAGRSTCNHLANLIKDAPLATDPAGMFEAFLLRIERASANVETNNNGNHENGIPVRQTGAKLLEKFCGLRPEYFDGSKEPWQAEQWLRQMDSRFETIKCNDQEKKHMATFQLTYIAVDWWDAKKATVGIEAAGRMPWVTFKERFLEKYFPSEERDNKKKEFINLT